MFEGPKYLVALLTLSLASSVFAGDDCEVALVEAERSYRAGRLEEVLALEEACIAGRAARDQQVEAYALLAKVYLALDEPERADEAVRALVRLDPSYRPAASDPVDFAALVAANRTAFTVNVGTVSKTDEPLREAPATVIVLTGEEIERRGYVDLEQLLHDLPGLDVSRGNGEVYSNVYMRGYRSDRSDRLMFLIDGVEQNDLHSNTAHISRQIPLSNIAQVEVVYGPASTIYGANAFNGVISVTTRSPQTLVAEGKSYGVHAQLAGGAFGTRYLDATAAGRSGDGGLAWSVTGRVFRSDEPDLSGFPEWDYDFATGLNRVDYQEVLRVDGALATDDDLAFFWALACFETRYCEPIVENGEIVAIAATEEGAAAARSRDRELFDLLGDLARSDRLELELNDETDDWALDAKLAVADLTLGVQTWRRQEGTTPWYTDFQRAGSGNVWTPKATAIYARYAKPVGRSLLWSVFSQYKQHELDGDSVITRFLTYAGGSLDLITLAFLERLFPEIRPSIQEITFDQRSTQFRNEMTLVYEPSSRFNLVGGLELRDSSIQVEFESEIPRQLPSLAFTIFEYQILDSHADVTDVGLYAQASLKPRDDLKVVLGGRLDSSSVRERRRLRGRHRLPVGLLERGVASARHRRQ